MPDVSSDGQLAVGGARSADNKDRWFVTIDQENGKTRVVDTLHDEAWIREAGAGFGAAAVEFLPESRTIWFLSERDGWMHLYTLDAGEASARPRQLTSGKWEITSADLAPDGTSFYITTTEQHPGERHLYIDVDQRRRPDENHRHRRIESGCRVARRRVGWLRAFLQQQRRRRCTSCRTRPARLPFR